MSSVAPAGARTRLVVTLVSLAAIVASVVVLTLLITQPRKTDSQKLADRRAQVASVANSFITALGTYDKSMLQGTTMPAYRANVEAVLTPKFSVAFEANGAPKAEKAVAVAGLKETVQIWSTGVASINDNQAIVLVVGALTDSIPKTAGGTDYKSMGEVPFRTVVTLVRIDGKWLVDGQAPAEGVPPTAPPSASAVPTPAPSVSSSATSGASK